MKKKILIWVAVLLLGKIGAFAGIVEIRQARIAAKNFYFERMVLNQQTPMLYSDISISSEYTKFDGLTPVYHVFNINSQAYIIITAEDACYPVLGYSYESTLSDDGIPENMKTWMENYIYEIKSVREKSLKPDVWIAGEWSKLLLNEPPQVDQSNSPADVAPLITSMWNQDFPYNALCPADPASTGTFSGRVPVGCVATAMSQIMHYWRYPVTGSGYHCIFPQQAAYGIQCADFGSTIYDWTGMPNQSNLESNALAILAYHCGVGVDMQYDPDGSGSNLQKATVALKNYFGYASTTQYQNRNSNYTTWVNTLKSNVDAGQPVEYAGDDNSAGHAFVLDGYQQVGSDYMFHFNWGWGGSANGYFYINNLNPNGSNFNSNQNAVVGIKPDPNLYPAQYFCSGTKTITTNFGSIEDGSGPLADYPTNTTCAWLIHPDDSLKTITLSFVRFNTATDDFVKVYDGSDASAPLIGSYSGNLSSIPAVTSTGPAMFITFVSNGSSTAQGWLADFSSTVNPFCGTSTTLTSAWGTISDGSNRFNYRNLSNCKWKIIPTGPSKIMLTVNQFNTEADNDKVMVYDLGTSALLATWSGNYTTLPEPLISNTGAVMVLWTTNNAVRNEGWEISYSPMVGSCETEAFGNLRVWPNPASDYLTIASEIHDNQPVELSLSGLSGQIMLQKNLYASDGRLKSTLDIRNLPSGVYVLKIKSNVGIVVQRIVIRKEVNP